VSRVTALIADDEPLARERVRTLLARHPDIEVLGEAGDGRQTLQMTRALRPSLLFLDVQMPEMNGFEVLEELPAKLTPEVVFVTAYDQFALQAFEVHAVDYLLKPFTRARFARAVDHSLRRLRQAPGTPDPRLLSLVEALRARQQQNDRLAVRDKDGVELVKTAEIDWLEGAGNYVKLHAGTREHLVRDTLKNLEERLDPQRFLRVHRSAIVNLDSIARLLPWFHGEYVVVLRDGTRLQSSRTYSERLRSLVK
jgi:two-component system, LytTR family, response regulator